MQEKMRNELLITQRNEITEHFIYKKLSKRVKEPHNSELLKRISEDELRHYRFWKELTHEDVKPARLKIWKYLLTAKILGLTFAVKLMEKGEERAQVKYGDIAQSIPSAGEIAREEDEHEEQLIGLIDEERLKYVGSMVLGLNDALVELTGALAGLTLALQNTRLIATAGLVTGIAASFSMAASEYLSAKTEGGAKDPVKASVYTGSAYVFTVLFLIFPYLIFSNFYVCLGVTIFNAISVIFAFSFYISVAKDMSFKDRFMEMVVISLGIASLSFVIGLVIRKFLNVEI